MDLGVPLRALSSSLDAEVLTVLAGTTMPLTGRRVAELAVRGSHHGVQKVLDRLVGQGLVLAQPAGPARLYQLNRAHLLAEAVTAAAGARRELLTRLRIRIEGWQAPCLHASVFGSVARGDATASSDIDVLLVRPEAFPVATWQYQLTSLEVDVLAWTGNNLAWFETSQADLARAYRADEPVLQAWREDNVHLAGQRLHRLIGALAS